MSKPGRKYYLFTDRKWAVVGGGYASSGGHGITGTLGRFYQLVVVPLILTGLTLSFLTAAVLSADDKRDVVMPFHFTLTGLVFLMSHLARSLDEGAFDEAVRTLRDGLFRYDGEESDTSLAERNEKGLDDMNRNLKGFTLLVITASAMFSAARPILLHIFINLKTDGKVINPYQNLPLYLFFETSSIRGLFLSDIVGSFVTCYLALSVICMEEMYVGATSNVKLQLELLNYSVSRLESRAYLRFTKKVSMPWDRSLLRRADFQECMYLCLRANVMHHQAILSIHKKLYKHYVGKSLLIVATMASITLAVGGFAILQTLKAGGGMLTSLPYIGLIALIALEIAFIYRFCHFGERIIKESEVLFELLYSTPWLQCGSKFRVLLIVMLCQTRKPLRLRTPFFSFTASYQSFGDTISLMYQLLNLARKAME